MATQTIEKKRQIVFRLEESLIDRLKKEANKENSSLNNYVEEILLDRFKKPNATTLFAMLEAIKDNNLEVLNLSSLDTYLKSIDDEKITQSPKRKRIPVEEIYFKNGDYKELVDDPFNLTK